MLGGGREGAGAVGVEGGGGYIFYSGRDGGPLFEASVNVGSDRTSGHSNRYHRNSPLPPSPINRVGFLCTLSAIQQQHP